MNRLTLSRSLVTLALCAAFGVSAQTPAEQAELDADAAGTTGPVPTGTTGGLTCPIGTVPTQFYFNDFEAGDGGWAGSGAGEWERGAVVTGTFANCDTTPRPEPTGAFSGTSVWATNLDGCYLNSGAESLLAQTFDFSALTAPIELTWQNWYEIFTPFDMGDVRVNGGSVLSITPSTATPDYVGEAVDLSAFAGNPSVTIDFRLFATTVVNRMGWYVDDIAITYCGQTPGDVQLTKSNNAGGTVAPGATLVYTLTVLNNGPGPANGVVVTDNLPAGVTYVSNTCGGSAAGNVFTWNVGTLANAASASCNVTVTVNAGASGTLVNNASVAAGGDPVPANNTASSTVGVGVPNIPVPTLGPLALALLAGLLLLVVATRRRARA